MFTNFKIDPATLADTMQAWRAGFAATKRPGTFEDNAARVIAERLRKHPEYHVEFGPYWWALKQVLIESGQDLGTAGNPMVAAQFKGASRAETLVLAEMFKDFYRSSYVVGTSSFDLDGDGQMEEMADPDMQVRAPA